MENWVSAGCGVIANELAQAMEKRGQKLYGVVNRTQEKAVAFAKKYGVQNVFTSFEEVCADPAVDIIYISTPHNTHIQFLRKALAAGKHVLCEKSITLNSEELEEAMQLAKEHGVVLPLRYNNDKRKKPLFSRGSRVCRHLFNSFSKLKSDEKNIKKRRLFH